MKLFSIFAIILSSRAIEINNEESGLSASDNFLESDNNNLVEVSSKTAEGSKS